MKIVQINKERHILREKELLNKLKHQNIIELYETFKVSVHIIFLSLFFNFQDEKFLYFVMEHGSNGTLDDLIKKTKGIGEEIAKIMFAQLINFVEYIMKIGVMHRDLKP